MTTLSLTAAAFGLWLASSSALAQSGTSTCPGSAGDGTWPPQRTLGEQALGSPQLRPGTTRPTAGTTLALSPELAGTTILSEGVTVTFLAPSGLVTVVLQQSVVNAANKSCVNYWQAGVTAESAVAVDEVLLTKFTHPKTQLYANYRTDLGPGIGSTDASRSAGKGNTITFHIPGGIAPGQTSAPLFLDTSVGATHKTGFVQFHTTDGGLSPPIPTWVPVWP